MPQTKRCPTCAAEQSSAEFGRDKARRDGLQSQCRACKSVGQRNWYLANKARHVANVGRRRRLVETEIIKHVIAYLRQHPCVDCGETDPVVLEFDHVRGHKEGSVCALVQRGFAWAAVSAEIQKCAVRCCNCHRRKTARQYGYRKMRLTAGP